MSIATEEDLFHVASLIVAHLVALLAAARIVNAELPSLLFHAIEEIILVGLLVFIDVYNEPNHLLGKRFIKCILIDGFLCILVNVHCLLLDWAQMHVNEVD